MAIEEGYVLPKPGIPKTLGILSVIFSVILILVGICGLGSILAGPLFAQFAETAVKDAQRKSEENTKTRTAALDAREKTAKTDEEKAAIKAERDAVVVEPKVPMIDMNDITTMMKDPTIRAFNYVLFLSGLAIHVVLLVAGIGLIRLTDWGRRLGIAWGGLQVVQIAILTAVSLGVVAPKTRAATAEIMAKAEAEEKAGKPANPALAGLKLAKSMEALALPMAIGQGLVGSIFPAILMIMLNGAGARAACRPAKSAGPGVGEF